MKFPRIYHLPSSPGLSSDDRRIESIKQLLSKQLVISEKLDGSNVCLTRKDLFARSHTGPPTHPSFDLLKSRWAEINYLLPEDIAVYAEWCFAVHSIEYEGLNDYLNIISVFSTTDKLWWSWEQTINFAEGFGLITVNELWSGKVENEDMLNSLISEFMKEPSVYGGDREGVIVRNIEEIKNEDFQLEIAKFVREGHVQTDEHWMNKPIKKQKIRK